MGDPFSIWSANSYTYCMAKQAKWLKYGIRIIGIVAISFIAAILLTQKDQAPTPHKKFFSQKQKSKTNDVVNRSLASSSAQPPIRDAELEAAAEKVFGDGPIDRASLSLILDYLWKEEDLCTLLVLYENKLGYSNQDLILKKLDLSLTEEARSVDAMLDGFVFNPVDGSYEKGILELETFAHKTDSAFLYFALVEISVRLNFKKERTDEYLRKAFDARNLRFYPLELLNALEDNLEKGPLHYLSIMQIASNGHHNLSFLLGTLEPISNWSERTKPERAQRAREIASLAEKEVEKMRGMPLLSIGHYSLQTFANGLRALFQNPTTQFKSKSPYAFYLAFEPEGIQGKPLPMNNAFEEEKAHYQQITQNLVQDHFEHCQDEEFLSLYRDWQRQRLGKVRNPR